MFANNNETMKQAAERIKGLLNELPNHMQHLPPELKADLNRMAQKVIKNGEKIGREDISELISDKDDLIQMEANIRNKNYGTNTSK